MREAGVPTPQFKKLPDIPQAPMLAMQVRANEYKKAHPKARIANFGLGEPPITDSIRNGLRSLTFPHVPQGQPTAVKEIARFGKEVVREMMKYSPKDGLPEIKEHFLGKLDAGLITPDQLVVSTNGKEVAFNHVAAAIREARSDKNADVVTIDTRQSTNLLDSIQQARNAVQSGKYVEFIVQDSATLGERLLAETSQLAQDGGVWLVDVITSTTQPIKSLGLSKAFPATTLIMDNISDLTGVVGIVANPDVASYIRERHANIEGPPAVGEMMMHVKLAELSGTNALSELMHLTKRQRNRLQKPRQAILGHVAQLFEYGLGYIQNGNTDAYNAFKQLVADQAALMENRAREFYKGDVLEQGVVYVNGGGRGAVMDILHMIHDLHYVKGQTANVIIPTATWSYDNLIDDSGNFKYVYTDSNAFKPNSFDPEPLKAKMAEYKGQHAVLIWPYGVHNPDNRIPTNDQIDEIVQAAYDYGVHIVTDQVYLDETPRHIKRYSPTHSFKHLQATGKIPENAQIFITSGTTYSKNDIAPGSRGATIHTNNPEELTWLTSHRDITQINPLGTAILSGYNANRDRMQQRVQDRAIKELAFRNKVVRKAADRRGLAHGNPQWGYYIGVESAAFKASNGDHKRALDETANRGALALPIEDSMRGGEDWANMRRVSMSGEFGRELFGRRWMAHRDFKRTVKHYFKVDAQVAKMFEKEAKAKAKLDAKASQRRAA